MSPRVAAGATALLCGAALVGTVVINSDQAIKHDEHAAFVDEQSARIVAAHDAAAHAADEARSARAATDRLNVELDAQEADFASHEGFLE